MEINKKVEGLLSKKPIAGDYNRVDYIVIKKQSKCFYNIRSMMNTKIRQNHIKKIGKEIASLTIKEKIAWGIVIFISILTFMSMWYNDLNWTYRHGLGLIDSIVAGDIRTFFIQSKAKVGDYAAYNISIYAIFAIWNIPTWFLTRFFQVSETAVTSFLWAKAMMVVFMVIAMNFMHKIAGILAPENKDNSIFIFASSLMVYCPIMATGQYDILEITFTLAGVYYCLKDRKISLRVILLFGIAISMKVFALFVYALLVLLVEKKVFRAIVDVMGGIIFGPILMLPFASEYYANVDGFMGEMTRYLFAYTIPSIAPGISLFWTGYIALCIMTFLSQSDSMEESIKKWIWYGAAFWVVFFVFAASHAYWIIWMAPFFALLITTNQENKRISILLLTIMETCFILAYANVAYWIYMSNDAFDNLIFKDYFANSTYPGKTLRLVVEHLALDYVFTGVCAAAFVTGLAIIIINNPWKKLIKKDMDESFLMSEQWLGIYRGLLLVAFFVATLICNIDAF